MDDHGHFDDNHGHLPQRPSSIIAPRKSIAKRQRIWQEEWDTLCAVFAGTIKKSFYRQLGDTVKALSRIKLEKPIHEAKYIGLAGEVFVRRDYFSLSGLMEKLADKGFVVLASPVAEWVRYVDFLRDRKMLQSRQNLAGALETVVSDFLHIHHERKIKRMLAQSGLYECDLIDIESYIAHSSRYFPWWFTGEPGISSGTMHHNLIDKWCGVVNAGPFGCMQARMTEAVVTPELTLEGKERASASAGLAKDLSRFRQNIDVLPFFNVEFDGNPFSQILETRLETFVLQSNRLYELMRREGRQRANRLMAKGVGTVFFATRGGAGPFYRGVEEFKDNPRSPLTPSRSLRRPRCRG